MQPNPDSIIFLSSVELETIVRDAVKSALSEVNSRQNEKELLNFKECCEFLGISASSLNKWKSKNLIPYRKLGKRIFFKKSEVLKALEDSNYYKLKQINN